MHTNAHRDLRAALCAIKAQQTVTVRLLRRWRRCAEISGKNEWTASGNSCRASPSCLIFFRLDVTYGAFHVGERVLLTSTWISRGGLVERRWKWRQHEKVARATGGEGREERVNTRRSAVVIMKAPTKLETPPLLISSRPTYVGCILTLRISLPRRDPGLSHIYLVRNVLCAGARTGR